MISFLNDNAVSIILCIISISVGGFASFYFYRKSIRRAKPLIHYTGELIFDEKNNIKPDKLRISFEDNEVSKLSRMYLWFWNGGTDVINRDDVVGNSPRINFPEDGGKILSVKVINETRRLCNINLSHFDENSIDLDFDFLDQGDGILIEVIHTYDSNNCDVVGIIKGVPSGIVNLGHMPSTISNAGQMIIANSFSRFRWQHIILYLIGLVSIYFSIRIIRFGNITLDSYGALVLMLIGVLIILPKIVIGFKHRKFNGIPEKLKRHNFSR